MEKVQHSSIFTPFVTSINQIRNVQRKKKQYNFSFRKKKNWSIHSTQDTFLYRYILDLTINFNKPQENNFKIVTRNSTNKIAHHCKEITITIYDFTFSDDKMKMMMEGEKMIDQGKWHQNWSNLFFFHLQKKRFVNRIVQYSKYA